MTKITRRTFGIAAGALAGSLAFSPSFAEDVTIVVNGSGGALAQTITKIFEEPFTKATGIKVRPTAPVSLPKLKAMVESGNVEWDVTELNGDDVVTATKAGWLVPIDYKAIDPDNKLPAIAKQPTALVRASYSTVIAFRTDKFGGKTPQSWADFWDVKSFPGPRSLENSPKGNLEFALLADGVAPDKLYPLDVDRAFKKLDQIKKHIPVWWTNGAQHVQLLIDGEVSMTSSWNGRITPLKNEGKPVDITFKGGALMLSYLGIPKGAKHQKEALQFMKFRMDPVASAEFVKQVPYPGFVPGMMELLDPAFAATLPTSPANAAVQFDFNSAWWADNLDAVQARWNEWLLI
ncbi:ABC transporter substrate-binding protein [Microvirga pudoricolor]|uniref:ABC transporter substrate-binding protein n=1 Tax=Microvirga pudoricolor TaxID=2778729 RepID=UPI001950535F|nr:ABC transporter substrate-binding protein [Microvirga pudoricolor]MBM6595112.1 ABC transporter substrate-binding protein [Microvirga pudoricolor]